MTDKEIRALIEKRRKEWRYGSSTEAKYKVEECDDILELLDSIQEEPVSNDLEEAVNAYIGYAPEVDESSSVYGKRRAFKAGAQWQKEQMIKDATEVTVHVDAGGYPYIPQMELYDYDKDIPLAKKGDKYNVVLIKKD